MISRSNHFRINRVSSYQSMDFKNRFSSWYNQGIAPSENKFTLQLEPADKITFSGPELDKNPYTVTLKLKNTASERLAYKVKCTSNIHFRIRPPVGLLEPGATADVQLTFSLLVNETTVPENGYHYFAIYHIKAPNADEKPRDTWTNHKGKIDGEKRLQVDFKKEAPAEIKPAAETNAAEEKKPTEDKKAPKEEEPKKDDATDKPAEKGNKKSDKEGEDMIEGGDDEDGYEESEDEDGDDDSK